MTVAGLWYLLTALEASRATGWAPPPPGILPPYVILVAIASVIAQSTLALLWPKQADTRADEREAPLLDRAGNWAGLMLGGGAIGALVNYMVHGSGDLLFHLIVGSLILSQIAEYALQILFFRRNG
ncbi:MAG TPA: hypothetical protein VIO94_03840 [Phenylobacterium sp.]